MDDDKNTSIDEEFEEVSVQTHSRVVENETVEDVMENNFLRYSMSVIIDRALPDVRDGLKPVHRRILYLSLIHISEPTRRTPISYAVFCLKKKKKLQTHTH